MIRKEGAGFDLPIAIGILSAIGGVSHKKAQQCVFLGELSLDGRVRWTPGALPVAFAAKEQGFKAVSYTHLPTASSPIKGTAQLSTSEPSLSTALPQSTGSPS